MIDWFQSEFEIGGNRKKGNFLKPVIKPEEGGGTYYRTVIE